MKNSAILLAVAITLAVPGARTAQAKWKTSTKVGIAVGAGIAAYGLYKLHVNAVQADQQQQRIDEQQQQIDQQQQQINQQQQFNQQQQINQQQPQAAQTEPQAEAATQPPISYPIMLRQDENADQGIMEIAPGACELRIYSSTEGFNNKTGTPAPCDSALMAPKVTNVVFVNGTCSAMLEYRVSGAPGVQQNYSAFSNDSLCGFTAASAIHATEVPGSDNATGEATCTEQKEVISSMNSSWRKSLPDVPVPIAKCNFKFQNHKFKLVDRKDGDLYPGCMAIDTYKREAAGEPALWTKASYRENDLSKCGIKTVDKMDTAELAHHMYNLAIVSMFDNRQSALEDARDAKNITMDNYEQPTSRKGTGSTTSLSE